MNRLAGSVAALTLVMACAVNPAQAATEPILMGHRGTGTNKIVPENTLDAFEWAVDNGADGIEFDARLTGTGKQVVMHDATLDRTTKCSGPVSNYSLTYITNCLTEFGNTHPPSVSKALDYAKSVPGLKVSVHVKADWPKSQMLDLATKIKSRGMQDRVNVTSNDKSNISDLAGAGVKRGLTWDNPSLPSVAYVKSYGNYFDPRFTQVSRGYVQALRAAGIVVTLWTGKSVGDYEDMNDLGADRWHVDDVAAARDWVNS